MMVATLRWRDEFKIDDVMKESFPEDVFGGLGYISGTDKRGAPVRYIFFRPWHIKLPADGLCLS
jgi:phosphatidylinositol transfer protein SFH5